MKIQSKVNLPTLALPATRKEAPSQEPVDTFVKSETSATSQFLSMTSHVATSAALPTGLGVAAFHAAQAGSTGLATGLGIAAGMTALPCAAGALLPIIFSGGSKSAVAGTVTGLALVATAAAFLLAGVPGF